MNINMPNKTEDCQNSKLLEDEASDADLQVVQTSNCKKIFFQVYVFILTFLTYAVLHLSREAWSFLKEEVKEEQSPGIGLSSNDLGTIDMFFLFSYSIGLFISGILGDKMNKNLLLGCGYLVAAGATVMVGLGGLWKIRSVWYYVGFFVISGFAQSVGWPSVVAVMANWFPKKGRGFWFGVWTSNPNVGNILGTLVSSLVNGVIGLSWGWTWIIVAIIVGTFGVINFIFMIEHPNKVGVVIQDELEEHDTMVLEHIDISREHGEESMRRRDLTNDDEEEKQPHERESQDVQEELEAVQSHHEHKKFNFFRAWLIPGVIQYSISYLALKLCNYGILLWLPTYVSEELDFSTSEKALVAILYDVGTIIGSVSLGLLSDMMYGKRVPVCFVGLLIATCLHSTLIFLGNNEKVIIFIVIFILGFFIGSIANIISGTACADIGKHDSIKGNDSALSTVTGIVDGTGSLGAAAGQKGIGYIQDNANWTAVFIMMTSFVFISSVPISCIFVREIKEIFAIRKSTKEEKNVRSF
ncbi:unnamed protein product [Moneuplotes crassus]|uniref:Major facilitator superfamily (MFS) profile domain-containing protein n=1 Tax=Euplotes crassus TaxID=5936 RepID=A0AAD1UC84_EUPCR|nr:unnamed protein product [Moneuplotes crassus]